MHRESGRGIGFNQHILSLTPAVFPLSPAKSLPVIIIFFVSPGCFAGCFLPILSAKTTWTFRKSELNLGEVCHRRSVCSPSSAGRPGLTAGPFRSFLQCHWNVMYIKMIASGMYKYVNTTLEPKCVLFLGSSRLNHFHLSVFKIQLFFLVISVHFFFKIWTLYFYFLFLHVDSWSHIL